MSDSLNPYGAPESILAAKERCTEKVPFWIRHLRISLILSFVWFFIGGAISIGGSRAEMVMDGLGISLCALYFCISLSAGLITGFPTSRRERQ